MFGRRGWLFGTGETSELKDNFKIRKSDFFLKFSFAILAVGSFYGNFTMM